MAVSTQPHARLTQWPEEVTARSLLLLGPQDPEIPSFLGMCFPTPMTPALPQDNPPNGSPRPLSRQNTIPPALEWT